MEHRSRQPLSLSPKQHFLRLPKDKQLAYIDSLTDEEAHALLSSWQWEARPDQLPPDGPWFVWLILSGRGWGKTRASTEFVVDQIKHHGYRRVALVGRTAADVRDVLVTGQSGILNVARARGLEAHHVPSKRQIVFDNGAVATTYSADAGDQLRGPEHDLALADELAAWPTGKGDADAWSNLLFGLRLGPRPRVVAATTPRPTRLIKQLVADDRTVVTRGSTFDNADNLAPSFLEEITRRYQGTRIGRQELEGELLLDTEGALWTHDLIDDARVNEPPRLQRVVVAVDPAVSTNASSDYTGVCVAGLGYNDEVYVLHAEQIKASPNAWASRVLDLADQHNADRIIAERNNGGDLVEHTLRSLRRHAPIRTIHASRGKSTRAEPVVAMYEQGKVHHVGIHADLEGQMTVFPVVTDEHDDLVDALVYAVTELASLDAKAPSPIVTFSGYQSDRRRGRRSAL